MEIEVLREEELLRNDNMSQDHQDSQRGDAELVKAEENFHVLAVDDSCIDRKILEKLLAVSSNYHVTLLESGDKALEYLGLNDDDSSRDPSYIHTTPPERSTETAVREGNIGMRVHLIMTDYSMPGMTGYDLLKRLKGSSWKDVPVVVMSSENVPSRINMCMEEGAEEFLLKPLRMSDLKRLQFYLVKSSCCRNISTPNSCSDNANDIHEIKKAIEDSSQDDRSVKRNVMVNETSDIMTNVDIEGVIAL